MSFGYQQSQQPGFNPPPNQSGHPPPYQPGAPPGALSYGPGAPPQPGAPHHQPGAPYQPGAPLHQPGAPYQPGAPPHHPGAPPPYQASAPPGAASQYAPFPTPSFYQQPHPQPGFQQPHPQPGYQHGPAAPPVGQHERCAVIRNSGSGLVLDASQYEVKLQRYTGSPAQLWFTDSVGGGKFIIRNKGNGEVLDIQGGPECGANLITYEKHGGVNQQWYINNHDHTITSATGNLAIDICEGNCYPGNFLIAYDKHGGPNQQFQLQYQ